MRQTSDVYLYKIKVRSFKLAENIHFNNSTFFHQARLAVEEKKLLKCGF